jgi:phage N-6-adenine-methyltransferase
MSRTMPKQQPGNSRQDYETPWELVKAVCSRLMIPQFSLDVAASQQNAKAPNYYTEADDALQKPWLRMPNGHWNWCNPPFGKCDAFTAKAVAESAVGASTAMLVPASVGSNWWRHNVVHFAYQVFLNGRITFVGAEDPYPKDCAILLYTPWGFIGQEIWHWRSDVP